MADDDSDVPESGAVFTFGKSKFADNSPNKFWIRNDKVIHVSCGDEHTALVATTGRVFMFGSNEWGQLGLGHCKPLNKPSCIKSLKHEKVQLVTCGRVHTIVATESGRLYTFGANGDSQLGLNKTDEKFISPQCLDTLTCSKYRTISAGVEHSAALTENGDVFVWGSNSEGQLGLSNQSSADVPTKLPMDEKIRSLSCGYYHTALITESGKLYTCGETDGGKLGHGQSYNNTEMQHVQGIKEAALEVSCGGSHTVVITEDGSCYSFGEGSNGQLGLGTLVMQADVPRLVTSLDGQHAVSVSCGESHTAVVTSRGHLYTFGDGRHGKLAQGDENFANQFKPSFVHRFDGFSVEKASCGGCHTLVLAHLRTQDDTWDSSPAINGVEDVYDRVNSLRKSEDLEGSFNARSRRRERQDLTDTLTRTLPPLSSSLGHPAPGLSHTLPLLPASRVPPPVPQKRQTSPPDPPDPEPVHAPPQPSDTLQPNADDTDEAETDDSEDQEQVKKPVPSPAPKPRHNNTSEATTAKETTKQPESEEDTDDEQEEDEDNDEDTEDEAASDEDNAEPEIKESADKKIDERKKTESKTSTQETEGNEGKENDAETKQLEKKPKEKEDSTADSTADSTESKNKEETPERDEHEKEGDKDKKDDKENSKDEAEEPKKKSRTCQIL